MAAPPRRSPRRRDALRLGGAWAADYAYAGWHQLRAALSRSGPDALLGPSAVDRPVPVVLLPGVYEPWRFLAPLAQHLRRAGYPVHVVETLGLNRGPVLDMAHRAAEVLDTRDLRRVVLVAHSKGGLVGKQLMLLPGAGDRITGMVTVNTPFAGSRYARYLPGRTLRAFSPRDTALLALARERRVDARIVSVFARWDPHIPGGSTLAGARRNVRLDAVGHFRVLSDPAVLEVVLETVEEIAGTAAPSAGDPSGAPGA
ncbi:alpha/beta fold hydrolase [Georgenia sp. MJ206]|uniref:esterase/lipase family protein n=1 Tax=Georgenia wangjunii TaxID=3117730 RepID=UPI002F268CA1